MLLENQANKGKIEMNSIVKQAIAWCVCKSDEYGMLSDDAKYVAALTSPA